MDRRAFPCAVTGTLLAAPIAADARAGKVWLIGILSPSEAEPHNPIDEAFERSLKDLGYIDGQNVRLEHRYSRGQAEAVQPLATGLVDLGVGVLVAWTPAGALAAKRATSQRPVVFLAVGDPVAFGLVSNLARPGGNITGISFDVSSQEIYAKSFQLLDEALPTLRYVALLASAEFLQPRTRQRLRAAATQLGLELQEIEVATPAQLDAAVRNAKDHGAQALYILPTGLA